MNHLKYALWAVMAIISASPCLAATEIEEVHVVKRDTYLYEDSSEANRMGKTWSLVGQLIGVGPSSFSTLGVDAGLFLDRNTLVMLEGTTNAGDKGALNLDTQVQATSVGIHLKKFASNSFYGRVGIDYRMIDYTYYNSFGDGTSPVTSKFNGYSIAAAAAIGNQWQWSNFTMGCDWIGVVIPFASDITGGSLSSNATSSDIFQRSTDKAKLFTNVTVEGLRFYLGASF